MTTDEDRLAAIRAGMQTGDTLFLLSLVDRLTAETLTKERCWCSVAARESLHRTYARVARLEAVEKAARVIAAEWCQCDECAPTRDEGEAALMRTLAALDADPPSNDGGVHGA